MEVFVGCLRGVEKGTREDVEIYLRTKKGLIIAMNKLEESKIDREFAKSYADTLKEVKDAVQEKEYTFCIPYYVWMDNVIRIVKYEIEEKHLVKDIQQKDDSIFKLKHDIDRNRIILDHSGIDPNEYAHMSNLNSFWRSHLIDLKKHYEIDADDLRNWDKNHIDEIGHHVHKHRDEKTTSSGDKVVYPVFGTSTIPVSSTIATSEGLSSALPEINKPMMGGNKFENIKDEEDEEKEPEDNYEEPPAKYEPVDEPEDVEEPEKDDEPEQDEPEEPEHKEPEDEEDGPPAQESVEPEKPEKEDDPNKLPSIHRVNEFDKTEEGEVDDDVEPDDIAQPLDA